ncbi:MAG: hypothetical protein R3264_03015 [Anaerolineae bacterium]|nr:hypothetical protein [Anaerolineae bacterium]
MGRRTRRKRRGIDRRFLILFSIMPVACLLAIGVGLAITWILFPTRFINAEISELSQDEARQIVVMAATDFAEFQDLDRAQTFLAELEVPNPAQYVSLVAEEMIRTNRGPIDPEIEYVVRLADALNVSTVSMIAYVSTATPTFTPTPIPTPTATNTPVIPTEIPTQAAEENLAEAVDVVAAESASLESGDEVAALSVEAVVTEPPPEPTETLLPPTATPAPPTNTPEPTATPVPDVDFVIKTQRLLSKSENGGCAGNHNIFVKVLDAAGNPIKGVQIGDVWNNPGPVTGHKGDDRPGEAEYDLYKNSGFHILVKSDPTAGRDVTSQTTELLSADDWKIGIPRLIEAGYCANEADCRVQWNSGVFGEGNNTLCWGHYSWEVVFQRTW